MLEPITDKVKVIELPPSLDMARTEAAVLDTVRTNWQQSPPDVIVIGGWPFFATAAQAEALGTRSIFIDAGAVAQDGIPDLHLPVQLELRRIRQLTLPAIDRVLPISSFIRSTQSEPDRGSHEGVRTVLLGADHMSLRTFSGDAGLSDVAHRIDALIRTGETLILLLGRFERAGYKNSSAAYELLRAVRQQLPRIRLLILDSGQDCAVPEDLKGAVELLGAPDDEALQYVMHNCAAGVSMSLWEGFNLPLAEMQWLNKPAFAYNIGAHPEVIADPWLLSDSLAEMVTKICNLLQGNAPNALEAGFTGFRQRRPWEVTLNKWEAEINELGSSRARVEVQDMRKDTRRIVLVDVSSSSMDPANPGVVRVTRRLCSWLQWYPNLELVFAAWHPETASYIFLNETRRRFLEAFGGPKDGLGLLATCGQEISVGQFLEVLRIGRGTRPLVFMPEVMFDGQAAARANWARENGYNSAAILYDLIPVFHQELCGPNVTAGFPGYLEALVTLDAVWSISHYTLEKFKGYVAQSGLPLPSVYEAIQLPGQFGKLPRRDLNGSGTPSEIRILCISTLEPRKNHLRLLQAFQRLREKRPELPLRLVLIGNRYASAPEIVEEIQSATQRDPTIEWHGIVDDERLASEFSSATFTVYPSLVEGFGLPILESLWMGRPCLTHNDGVMYELAKEGGCVAADMTDVDAILRELERLATDRDLLMDLTHSANKRHISTWEEYATEVADRLSRL
jgi:glycosyltransferase involved in cell wall biosynthesis